MIAKGGSIGHGGTAISYGMEKEESQEISRNLVSGDNKKEILQEFKSIQDMNTRCSKNTFAFVISPDKADKLQTHQYKEITDKFLDKMNLSNNQHVAYLHFDNKKKIPHIHVYVNRIGLDAKAAPDQFISNKASHSADLIAQEMNLIQARQVQAQKLEQSMKLNKHVFKAHKEVLSTKPKSVGEYAAKMTEKGFKPKFKQSSTGKIVGAQFNVGKELIKGSAINPAMAGAKIVTSLIQGLSQANSLVQSQSKGHSLGR